MAEFLNQDIPEKFLTLYRDLVAETLKRDVLSKVASHYEAADVAYLLSHASRLSLSSEGDSESDAFNCQLAYDIAVRLPDVANGTREMVAPLCEAILSRLGNFPARSLMFQRAAEQPRVRDPFIELESAVREEENRRADAPDNVSLTDFQFRLLGALRSVRNVSVSAPTSAGKSFTLELELLHRLESSNRVTAVFLVPTRALIRQVSLDIVELIHRIGIEASVLSTISVPLDEKGEPREKQIFVLTQERFATLLAEAPPQFDVNILIIDEAQEIGKDRRGMTLERVIQLALRRFPILRVFFSSPLRSNPEYLLSLFSLPAESSISFVEHQRPVTQQLISVHKVDRQPTFAKLVALHDLGNSDLGTIELPFRFRDNYLAQFAKYFSGTDDVSIIYCNRPSAADRVAGELSDITEESSSELLQDFAAFLKQEVHRHYRLASMILHGVAFHYANIPQIIRSRIEELAKERVIKFVCCTSTLLQGVNLPAKNIFLENPKTGQGSDGKISPGDFWNLVGRAGRMSQEFTGNVFCVYGKKWDSDPLSGDRLMPIQSAFQAALTQRAEELSLWARSPAQSADGGEAWAEQAFANIFSDYVSSGQLVSEFASNAQNRKFLEQVDAASERYASERTLPDIIYTNNMYLHPSRLEDLASRFRNAPSITLYFPVMPGSKGSYDRLSTMFGLIDEVFIKSGTQRHRYFAYLAEEWMKGSPVRELVKARLDYHGVPDDPKKVNDEIRELFQEIEEDLRYRYVKYVGVYLQVLTAVLENLGSKSLAEKLLPIHLFLEFGASTRALINLMALGLSRTSALLLQRRVQLSSETTIEQAERYLAAVNIDLIDLPKICKDEIRKFRRKRR